MEFDVSAIRRQFPILSTNVGGNPLVYLDSAATAQKPQVMLDAMTHYYRTANANAHRSMYPLAEAATEAFEGARETVRRFLNAKHADEIVFTKSCTEAINIVARSWGSTMKKGDLVILTMLEHHANIVPWQMLKEECGIELRWVGIDDHGQLNMDELRAHLADGKAKLVAVTALSNVLGTTTPIAEIATLAHAHGALVLVDAAQAVAHGSIDVQKWGCDFLAFSGHKLYGPTGIGILYGRRELLNAMPPFLGGGMMIGEVTTEHFTPADPPARFEGGTQPVVEAIGLKAAIDWLSQYSWSDVEAHEHALLATAAKQLSSIAGLQLLGPWKDIGHWILDPQTQHLTSNISGCLSFIIDGVHPHDLTEILGQQGICLRAGHHCAQPLHRRLGINASTRLSVGIYNTLEEISSVGPAIMKACKILNPKLYILKKFSNVNL